MILLYHPKATRPRNRRFPLSILALAAILEGREDYAIVDGNVEDDGTGGAAGAATGRTSNCSRFP